MKIFRCSLEFKDKNIIDINNKITETLKKTYTSDDPFKCIIEWN